MIDDYGKKIGRALEAIRRLHSDASRFLQACDGTIGKGKEPVHGSCATKELTLDVRAEFWMAEAVYRYYYADDGENRGQVDGVTVLFIDRQRRVDEPLLIAAQLQYRVDGEAFDIRSTCHEWDIWRAFFEWSETRKLGEILVGTNSDGGRIEWVKLIAVPAYSIQSMQHVEKLMNQVRNTSVVGQPLGKVAAL
jgi:hypothetical protein